MTIKSYDELQAMTPDQRREHFEQSIVWDPEHHPDPAVQRLHRRAQERAQQFIDEDEGA